MKAARLTRYEVEILDGMARREASATNVLAMESQRLACEVFRLRELVVGIGSAAGMQSLLVEASLIRAEGSR